ncbi:MAG: winged helix-turn-helix domain-containing protein [Pirellulales bacterium]|nr:winged helix-turn-helix domain-containing protein [Pirellulales bacterium]
MSTTDSNASIARIGQAAGAVWHTLAENGPLTLTKLVEATGQPRDTVMQALGWLAREDKISIEEDGRKRIVSLRS